MTPKPPVPDPTECEKCKESGCNCEKCAGCKDCVDKCIDEDPSPFPKLCK